MSESEDFYQQTTIPDLHASTRPLPLPSQIGPYLIKSLLSKGGMSALYLATHPESGEPIVIKVLLPKYSKNKEITSRFLNEAQIIGMTNHPNIIRLYGQGTWEKGLYIAMEFVQGISLRQFIQKKSLSQKRALEIILQVAYALSHLHAHGVIHRDLKPENILITETGEIKVIDFGIAQLHTDLEQERITQKKRLMGTPIYMSPEQKENPLHLSYSSDIYSLGIVAYELILGRLSHGVIHLALLPKSLRSILEKMLQENPKERYQDVIECIGDLSHYLKTLSESPQPQEEEISDEILKMIEETRSLLLPKKMPHHQFDIDIAVQESLSLSSFYLELFSLPKNQTCLLLASPLQPNSLFQTATFRGIAQGAFAFPHSPSQIGELLPKNHAFCLLFLLPDSDQISLICHSWPPLWHLPADRKTPYTLTSPNPTLHTTENWSAGDRLILSSLPLPSPPTPLPSPHPNHLLLSLHRLF